MCKHLKLTLSTIVLTSCLAILFTFCFSKEESLASEYVKTNHVNSRLVSSVSEIIPGEPFYLAFHLKIKKHWHVYWRNPGSSGESISLEWNLPKGFHAGDIIWPAPKRVPTGPIVNYGYENEVYLPVSIQVPETLTTQQNITFDLEAFWLVCKDICIPESGNFSITLPISSTQEKKPTPYRKNILDTVKNSPKQRADIHSLLTLDEQNLLLTLKASFLGNLDITHLYFFPYVSGLIDHDEPQKAQFYEKGVQLNLTKGPDIDALLKEPVLGVLSYQQNGERTFFELEIPPSSQKDIDIGSPIHKQKIQSDHTKNISFLTALFLAFLGGLILNLMPCVFPVLSIKAMSLARIAHTSPNEIKKHGIFFLFGVLISFLILAGVLILLKALGSEIGWGFQLQSPLVVASLALLMFLIGLNFLGYFDVQLSIGGKTLGLTERNDHTGAFFTGVLTVLVATPCTAPFMAAALGFALTQPWIISLIVFLGLGFGLAFPFFILSFFPKALKILPKPGSWMVRFKEFLAFPMFAAAIWLVWVLARQLGADSIIFALIIALSTVLFIWSMKSISKFWAKIMAFLAILTLSTSLYFLSAFLPATPFLHDQTPKSEELAWSTKFEELAWSTKAVDKYTSEGKVVFVDFTADWCIICKVNEKLVLKQKKMRQFLNQNNVVFMVADWTQYDPEISLELKKYNRAGVPLYLVYPGKKDSTPYLLPQLLTGSIIKKAVLKAMKNSQ